MHLVHGVKPARGTQQVPQADVQMVPSCSVAKERSRIGVVANVVLQLVAQAHLLLNAQELRTIQAPVCWRFAVRHNQELHAG